MTPESDLANLVKPELPKTKEDLTSLPAEQQGRLTQIVGEYQRDIIAAHSEGLSPTDLRTRDYEIFNRYVGPVTELLREVYSGVSESSPIVVSLLGTHEGGVSSAPLRKSIRAEQEAIPEEKRERYVSFKASPDVTFDTIQSDLRRHPALADYDVEHAMSALHEGDATPLQNLARSAEILTSGFSKNISRIAAEKRAMAVKKEPVMPVRPALVRERARSIDEVYAEAAIAPAVSKKVDGLVRECQQEHARIEHDIATRRQAGESISEANQLEAHRKAIEAYNDRVLSALRSSNRRIIEVPAEIEELLLVTGKLDPAQSVPAPRITSEAPPDEAPNHKKGKISAVRPVVESSSVKEKSNKPMRKKPEVSDVTPQGAPAGVEQSPVPAATQSSERVVIERPKISDLKISAEAQAAIDEIRFETREAIDRAGADAERYSGRRGRPSLDVVLEHIRMKNAQKILHILNREGNTVELLPEAWYQEIIAEPNLNAIVSPERPEISDLKLSAAQKTSIEEFIKEARENAYQIGRKPGVSSEAKEDELRRMRDYFAGKIITTIHGHNPRVNRLPKSWYDALMGEQEPPRIKKKFNTGPSGKVLITPDPSMTTNLGYPVKPVEVIEKPKTPVAEKAKEPIIIEVKPVEASGDKRPEISSLHLSKKQRAEIEALIKQSRENLYFIRRSTDIPAEQKESDIRHSQDHAATEIKRILRIHNENVDLLPQEWFDALMGEQAPEAAAPITPEVAKPASAETLEKKEAVAPKVELSIEQQIEKLEAEKKRTLDRMEQIGRQQHADEGDLQSSLRLRARSFDERLAELRKQLPVEKVVSSVRVEGGDNELSSAERAGMRMPESRAAIRANQRIESSITSVTEQQIEAMLNNAGFMDFLGSRANRKDAVGALMYPEINAIIGNPQQADWVRAAQIFDGYAAMFEAGPAIKLAYQEKFKKDTGLEMSDEDFESVDAYLASEAIKNPGRVRYFAEETKLFVGLPKVIESREAELAKLGNFDELSRRLQLLEMAKRTHSLMERVAGVIGSGIDVYAYAERELKEKHKVDVRSEYSNKFLRFILPRFSKWKYNAEFRKASETLSKVSDVQTQIAKLKESRDKVLAMVFSDGFFPMQAVQQKMRERVAAELKRLSGYEQTEGADKAFDFSADTTRVPQQDLAALENAQAYFDRVREASKQPGFAYDATIEADYQQRLDRAFDRRAHFEIGELIKGVSLGETPLADLEKALEPFLKTPRFFGTRRNEAARAFIKESLKARLADTKLDVRKKMLLSRIYERFNTANA